MMRVVVERTSAHTTPADCRNLSIGRGSDGPLDGDSKLTFCTMYFPTLARGAVPTKSEVLMPARSVVQRAPTKTQKKTPIMMIVIHLVNMPNSTITDGVQQRARTEACHANLVIINLI